MCKLIKILDEQIAGTLQFSGFSYMQEKINNEQTLYVFEETPELLEILGEIKGEFGEAVIISDTSLSFQEESIGQQIIC